MRRPNWLQPKQVALFVAVAALVAVVGVVVGREAGLGERAAVAEGEPLTLTLSPSQQICETREGQERGIVHSELDANGNRSQRRQVLGWYRISSVPVAWRVSGGEAPYSLVIDNESAYLDDHYVGATGTATVGCADTSVGTSFRLGERLYAVDPQVDSGWKTIRAVVTDANGETAEATAEILVILVDPVIMTRGQTYRVWGNLITAPPTHDLRVTGIDDVGCAVDPPHGSQRCDLAIGFKLLGTEIEARLYLHIEDAVESRRWQILGDGTIIHGRRAGPTGTAEQISVDAAFDAIADSVGTVPIRNEN